MKNIFYFRRLNEIGGIETFFYYIAKKYFDWDITIYYVIGNIEQINRIKKYARVKQYNGEKLECEKIFFNYNLDIIENVEAKEYYQIVHGCYKKLGIMPQIHEKITKYLGVSKAVCEDFKALTGLNIELAYNPIQIDEPKKVLNLVSATRLSAEKGKLRIKKLGEILDKAGIPYIWLVFTNDEEKIKNPNIVYMKSKLNIIDYIANADYLVQLSDEGEGYGYSTAEALSVGTPVIITDVPAFKEIGVIDGINGFILDFDLSNVPVEDIYKGLPKFKYEPKKDNWANLLAKGPSIYKEELKMKVKVQCVNNYFDMQLGENIAPSNDPFIVNEVRAKELVEAGVCIKIEEIKEEVKPEVKEEVKPEVKEVKKAAKKNTKKK